LSSIQDDILAKQIAKLYKAISPNINIGNYKYAPLSIETHDIDTGGD